MAGPGIRWRECDHGVHSDGKPGRCVVFDDRCADVQGDGPDKWHDVYLHGDGDQREWHGACVSGVDRGHSGEAEAEHAAGGAGDLRHGRNSDHANGGVRAEELHPAGDLCDLAGAAGGPVDGSEHGCGVGNGHGRLPDCYALDLGDHYGQRGDDVVGAHGVDRGPVSVSEPLSDGFAFSIAVPDGFPESDGFAQCVSDGFTLAVAFSDRFTESVADELTESDGFAQSVSDGFTLAVAFAVPFPGTDSDA